MAVHRERSPAFPSSSSLSSVDMRSSIVVGGWKENLFVDDSSGRFVSSRECVHSRETTTSGSSTIHHTHTALFDDIQHSHHQIVTSTMKVLTCCSSRTILLLCCTTILDSLLRVIDAWVTQLPFSR
eukprot:scaffold14482_cov157-Amphora_coffeaeformis.AAC.1